MLSEPSINSTPLVDEMSHFLESVFILGESPLSLLNPDVTAKFLLANKMARESGNRDFEQTQLLIGKACDERCKDKGSDEIYDYFLKLVEHVNLYDDTLEQINRLAIMEMPSVNAEMIMSLYRNKLVFDMLDESLFERLFCPTCWRADLSAAMEEGR